jgi:two-component system chemotaxis response regulator CheY
MSKKKVLIVDDSSTVRQQVAQVLTQVGFLVLEAPDGQVGVEMIEKDSTISCVICDVNMPRMNGIEMVETVKRDAKNKALPVLMLTTDGQPSLIKRATDAGASGWVVKPFNPTQLVAVVQKLTNGTPRSSVDRGGR